VGKIRNILKEEGVFNETWNYQGYRNITLSSRLAQHVRKDVTQNGGRT
jgi:hypothetical protein